MPGATPGTADLAPTGVLPEGPLPGPQSLSPNVGPSPAEAAVAKALGVKVEQAATNGTDAGLAALTGIEQTALSDAEASDQRVQEDIRLSKERTAVDDARRGGELPESGKPESGVNSGEPSRVNSESKQSESTTTEEPSDTVAAESPPEETVPVEAGATETSEPVAESTSEEPAGTEPKPEGASVHDEPGADQVADESEPSNSDAAATDQAANGEATSDLKPETSNSLFNIVAEAQKALDDFETRGGGNLIDRETLVARLQQAVTKQGLLDSNINVVANGSRILEINVLGRSLFLAQTLGKDIDGAGQAQKARYKDLFEATKRAAKRDPQKRPYEYFLGEILDEARSMRDEARNSGNKLKYEALTQHYLMIRREKRKQRILNIIKGILLVTFITSVSETGKQVKTGVESPAPRR